MRTSWPYFLFVCHSLIRLDWLTVWLQTTNIYRHESVSKPTLTTTKKKQKWHREKGKVLELCCWHFSIDCTFLPFPPLFFLFLLLHWSIINERLACAVCLFVFPVISGFLLLFLFPLPLLIRHQSGGGGGGGGQVQCSKAKQKHKNKNSWALDTHTVFRNRFLFLLLFSRKVKAQELAFSPT